MDVKGDAIVQQAIATAIGDAETLWAPEKFDGVFATKGFGIRTLQKWDVCPLSTTLGGARFSNSWVISITTAKTWECILSHTVSQDAYLILTGIFNYDANPDMTDLQIVAEGVEYMPWHIEEMYGWDVAVAYLSHPVVVRPQKKVLVYARAESAGQKSFGFIGYTLGKRGYLINRVNGT
jgi:hypothetical protein